MSGRRMAMTALDVHGKLAGMTEAAAALELKP